MQPHVHTYGPFARCIHCGKTREELAKPPKDPGGWGAFLAIVAAATAVIQVVTWPFRAVRRWFA